MSMIQLKEVLLDRLKEPFARHQFRLIQRVGYFVRHLPGLRHIYQIRFVGWGMGYLVSPAVGIRIDQVEAVFHRVSGIKPVQQEDSLTIGAEVGNLLGQPSQYEYRLEGIADLDRVSASVIEVFASVALPYFREYSSVAAIDLLLNEEPERVSSHRNLPFLRATTGLIVARLAGRKDYARVQQMHRSVLGKASGSYLPQFDALSIELDSLS